MSNQLTKEILAFERDYIWIHENLDALLEKYPEQWIAVKYHQVIASDIDFFALRKKLPDPPHTCIEFITRERLEIVL